MYLDARDKEILLKLSDYLESRTAKDVKALTQKLRRAGEEGEVRKGAFTMADVNAIQSQINTQEFLASNLGGLASPPDAGAPGVAEAAQSKSAADLLRRCQDLVRTLV